MRACPYLDIAEMDVSSRIFSCVAYARATNRMIRENGSCMRIHSCISSLETSFFNVIPVPKHFVMVAMAGEVQHRLLTKTLKSISQRSIMNQ
jgi:hypothetical protein